MKKKKPPPKRKSTPPRKMGSGQLCASLAAMAAFHIEDKRAQMMVYEAIRRLQMLEKAAVDAGRPAQS